MNGNNFILSKILSKNMILLLLLILKNICADNYLYDRYSGLVNKYFSLVLRHIKKLFTIEKIKYGHLRQTSRTAVWFIFFPIDRPLISLLKTSSTLKQKR